MNCHYSNLIEGQDTHPVDIERAMKNDYSQDARTRDLQLEAKAHIAVQQWIDGGGLGGGVAIRPEGIREIHRRFCELLPEDLLRVEDPATGKKSQPCPASYAGAASRLAPMLRSVQVRFPASWSASDRYTPTSARLNPSFPQPRLTIDCCGFIRSRKPIAA
jgi:hypothetical protein